MTTVLTKGPTLRKRGTAGVRPWLLLDSKGETQVVEAGKYALMRRTGVPASDLRVLDPMLSYPSTILGRERAIVISLEHIKAIATPEEVLLLNSRDPSVAPFVEELQRRVQCHYHATKAQDQNEESAAVRRQSLHNRYGSVVLPFEFVALEACLEAACRSLENEAKALELEAYPALDKLTSKISTSNLERVRQIKSRLVALSGRVQKVRDELEHLLDDDEHMAEMYLTDKLIQPENSSDSSENEIDDDIDGEVLPGDVDRRIPADISLEAIGDSNRYEGVNQNTDLPNRDSPGSSTTGTTIISKQLDVAELEMLLEAYFVQIDGTVNKLSTLREYVDDTEDYINIILDDKQNQLLRMGVMMTTATLSVTFFIVLAGIMGMNVRIHLFKLDMGTGFPRWLWTTGGCCAATILIYVLAISLYKYKRLI